MSRFRLWPAGLAGRLVILLVAALALAQVGLVFTLRSEQDAILDQVVHGQALNQTVTLTRLLAALPPDRGDELAKAFGSRESCADISREPPASRPMNPTEARLARLLGRMLHGVEAGPPQIAIERMRGSDRPCIPTDRPDGMDISTGTEVGTDPGPPPPPGPGPDPRRVIAVSASVPLDDGRWLTMRSALGVPPGWNRAALLSFLLSSLAVGTVAVVAIRRQTRSLRTLAEASDRFGRGEAVTPLPENGPAEVAAATRAFNTMQERLSLFLRDRLRLLASISHDLRTPLTTLRLKAEFIDDETMREDLIATIDELTVICEATLAFTRAEATAEDTVSVQLEKLVGDVAEELRLGGADVTVTATGPVTYACRPVSLKRAVRNLMENAVRYGQRADVAIHADDGEVHIAVQDEGPGLPDDRIEEAFQPFVRIEPSRNAETGGIGLGLAIARSIVKAHGGTLTLANRAEGGLRAEIRLPRQTGGANPAA